MVRQKSIAIKLFDLVEFYGQRWFDVIFSAINLACLWLWNHVQLNNESRPAPQSVEDAKTTPDD